MEEWEKTARSLPCGRTVRVKCCKADRSRIISHSEKGYGTYCFRCGEESRRFKPHGQRSLQELIQHRRELDAYILTSGVLSLPTDYEVLSDSTPREALGWLLISGVSIRLARHYSVGWSESLGRVILPVWNAAGDLLEVQCRAVFDWQKPKYLNKSRNKNEPSLFWSDTDLLPDDALDTLIVTEDILSCIRCGETGGSVSTLGTSLSAKAAARLLHRSQHGFIWYDGDAAGINGARKAVRMLNSMGGDYRMIRTPKDPKCYNNEEIRSIINAML